VVVVECRRLAAFDVLEMVQPGGGRIGERRAAIGSRLANRRLMRADCVAHRDHRRALIEDAVRNAPAPPLTACSVALHPCRPE
jgi:hypothetical protein